MRIRKIKNSILIDSEGKRHKERKCYFGCACVCVCVWMSVRVSEWVSECEWVGERERERNGNFFAFKNS